MAKKREKIAVELINGRVLCNKRVLVNMGDYSSYSIEYGLESDVPKGMSGPDAMDWLKDQVEDQVNTDLDEVDDVEKKIPRPPKNKKSRRK